MKRTRICERINENAETKAKRLEVVPKLRRLDSKLKCLFEEVSELKRTFEGSASLHKEMRKVCPEESRTGMNQESVVTDSYSYLRWLIEKSNSFQSGPLDHETSKHTIGKTIRNSEQKYAYTSKP
jgi:hypothetical protein